MTLIEQARLFAHTFLDQEKMLGEITPDIILKVVERVSAINIIPGQEFDKNELFEILFSDYSIGKGTMTIMSEDVTPWLADKKAGINFELWNRYKLFINKNDPSFPIGDLHDFTDKILDKCINPKDEGSWDRRGMVVGHVQSGKTSNYVGLINKATDAGYKVIIVIAGSISSLRRQTQERIDEGYIGRSSSAYIQNGKNSIIGVGEYPAKTQVYSFTSAYYLNGDEGDFNQSIATRLNIPIGVNPVVFVIKKQKNILENLIDWLGRDTNIQSINGSPKLFGVPALVIDDEADSYSVNTTSGKKKKALNASDLKKENAKLDKIKTINKLIRTLLNLFNQNTFIGYTATPYANLYISPKWNDELTTIIKKKTYSIGEDLFPRDFIVNIQAPKNYIGAAKIFGLDNENNPNDNDPLDIFREINDFDPPFFNPIKVSNRNDLPTYLPKSLELAIKSFILTCTIRRLRGHEKKHNSMLVHVALFVNWIDRVALLVDEKLEVYKNLIEAADPKFIKELKDLYENDFLPTTENILDNLDYTDLRIKPHAWEEILIELKNGSSKIQVRAVHGTRALGNLEFHKIDEINYRLYSETGLSVIAVGGNRLARGITLEGLSISYYLRATKMYDSLMQMGRWFGYRPGYVDLCRLFTTEEIFRWFNHITMATEEMREEFDLMTRQNKKPKDFKLKVRNFPGSLIITSLSKMYHSEQFELSFSGSNLQSYQLTKSKNVLDNNYDAFIKLFDLLGYPKGSQIIKNKEKDLVPKYLIYKDADKNIICDFLDAFKTETPKIQNTKLSEYITNQTEIKTWTVVLVSNTDERVFIDPDGKSKKNERSKNKDVVKYSLNWPNGNIELGCPVRNQRGTLRDGKYFIISKNQIDTLMDRQIDLSNTNLKKSEEINKLRREEGKGLLLLYPLDPRGTANIESNNPVIGYSIYFPEIEKEVPLSYTSNLIGNFDEEVEEGMDDDDDDDDNDE